jgi:hypothetical protein
LHEFFLDVEPITGSSVNTAFRFQLNLALTRNPGLFRFRNIRETVLPVLWQEITLEMPEAHQRMLRLMNMAPQVTAQIVFALAALTSLILLALGVRTHFVARRLQAKQSADQDDMPSVPPIDKLTAVQSAQVKAIKLRQLALNKHELVPLDNNGRSVA